MHSILEYFHELKKEKLRMLLTVAGVCWGMANIVLMLSVGEGLYRALDNGARSMGDGIVIVWSGQTSKAYAGFKVGRNIRITDEDIALIKKRVREIDQISAEHVGWNENLKNRKKNISGRISGVYPSYGPMRNMIPEAGGRFINELDMKYKRRVIFIGTVVRDKLFGEGVNPVGETILINEIPFTVIGVMKKKIQTNSYSGMDWDLSEIPATTFRTMYNRKYINNAVFTTRVKDEAHSKAAIKEFRRVLAAKYRFDPDDEDTIRPWDTIQSQRLNSQVLRGIQIFMGIIGALTLIIAGIGVANIMYVTVKERTREIGIKMAVGAKPSLIIGQFVIEGLLTVSLGGALGILLGLGMIEAIKNLPFEHQAMEFVGKPVFSAMLALICSTILTFIGLLSGIFPANRASKVDPVEALRYE